MTLDRDTGPCHEISLLFSYLFVDRFKNYTSEGHV